MFSSFHVDYDSANKVLEAVKGGFISWGLLIASMGIIFISVTLIKKIIKRRMKDE